MFGGQGTRKSALQKKQARVDDINANANAGSKNLLSSVPKSDGVVKAICYKKNKRSIEAIFEIIYLNYVHF
jgi:sorbitol-specific phosphotransferase system component IIBC